MGSWPSIGGRSAAPVCWKTSAHMCSMMELMMMTLEEEEEEKEVMIGVKTSVIYELITL